MNDHAHTIQFIARILRNQLEVAKMVKDDMNARCNYMTNAELNREFEGQGLSWGDAWRNSHRVVDDIILAMEWLNYQSTRPLSSTQEKDSAHT